MNIPDLLSFRDKKESLMNLMNSCANELINPQRIQKTEFETVVMAAKADGIREFLEILNNRLDNLQ